MLFQMGVLLSSADVAKRTTFELSTSVQATKFGS